MSKSAGEPQAKSSAYHHGDLSASALTAALRALETDGAEALSLRKLAAELGVTHRALYRHYPDKAALIAAAAEEGYRRLTDEASADGKDAAGFARAYIRFALARPGLYAVMMAAPSGEKPEGLYRAIGDLIRAAKEAFGDDLAVKRAWTILHGGVSLHQAGAYAARSEEELGDFLLTLAGIEEM
ncbi:TetR/AcrR family transcriptional regulator [Parvularcula maris]|uniref:TetR/AcrR family transcriptional regulator n=1 Tax=Parvularcula maris TaxID=2965077 RepID=A0A9X2RL90_9PROT|nr:TetR/AcrR family transcriptional regulator [Parvularcula maris]MCQ8186588.1 TetR/AcrR family transcriptional regulator [Parvularcula maris]